MDGRAHWLGAGEMAVLLGDGGVGLALLDACHTGSSPGEPFAGVAPAVVRAGLPAVVAMQAPLPDDSAVRFARNVYAALADGLPLDAAVVEGRKAVSLTTGVGQPDSRDPTTTAPKADLTNLRICVKCRYNEPIEGVPGETGVSSPATKYHIILVV